MNKLFLSLKTRLKSKGFDDAVLQKLAKILETQFSITEESDEEAINNAISAVEPLAGIFQSEVDSVRSDRARVEKELAELKAKQKPIEKEEQTPEDMPSWAKSLIESNEKLQKDLNEFKGAEIGKVRQKEFSEIISKLPASIKSGYEFISVHGLEDSQYQDLIEKVKVKVLEVEKEIRESGATFGGVGGGNATVGEATVTEKEIEEIRRRTGGVNVNTKD